MAYKESTLWYGTKFYQLYVINISDNERAL